MISIHASRMGCDLTPYVKSACREFQSTHPVWDATNADDLWVADLQISIHASRMGCDEPWGRRADGEQKFQSTHPVWDATLFDAKSATHEGISIHASRMGCDWFACGFFRLFFYFNPRIPYGMRRDLVTVTQSANPISIHASRMGCDSIRWIHASGSVYFNPRIPYGMRPLARRTSRSMSSFQSTHPVWDATRQERLVVENQDFNPRIPYGMRRGYDTDFAYKKGISIHASRMGCDQTTQPSRRVTNKFQSTHPVWDATGDSGDLGRLEEISIHASRMGCDFDYIPITHIPRFQSTHPVWDATVGGLGAEGDFSISIHASRMGCDPPHSSWLRARRLISIHASRMGCDRGRKRRNLPDRDFNPRIPYGMRLYADSLPAIDLVFQSTHPVWDATYAVGNLRSER